MSGLTPTEAQRLIAAEFEGQGWEYDLVIGRLVVAEVQRRGAVDPASIEPVVPAEFARKNGTTKGQIADAIVRALGTGPIGMDEAEATTITINNQRYSFALGAGAQIRDSNLNVGSGTQIAIDNSASKDEVLAAVTAIVYGGVTGDWNAEAARDLAAVVDDRDDVSVDEIHALAAEVAKASGATQGRVREMLKEIATGGLGGALGTGLSSGLGELLSQLPI